MFLLQVHLLDVQRFPASLLAFQVPVEFEDSLLEEFLRVIYKRQIQRDIYIYIYTPSLELASDVNVEILAQSNLSEASPFSPLE